MPLVLTQACCKLWFKVLYFRIQGTNGGSPFCLGLKKLMFHSICFEDINWPHSRFGLKCDDQFMLFPVPWIRCLVSILFSNYTTVGCWFIISQNASLKPQGAKPDRAYLQSINTNPEGWVYFSCLSFTQIVSVVLVWCSF